MKLAIVVPCFNQVNTTKSSLYSLFASTKTPFTLVAVDDCSTDGTEVYFTELQKTQDIIYVRNPENYGVNRSWNIGVKTAKEIGADVVAIVNNDLLYTDNWEFPILEALADKSIGIVSPLSTCGQLPPDWPKGIRKAPNPAGYTGYMPILGACFACRTDLFDDIGYFPEELKIYYGDNWICLAAQAAGYKSGYVFSYVHHLMCQTTSKLDNKPIWQTEMPIFRELGRREFGEHDACSIHNNVFKPFVKQGQPWQPQMHKWRYGISDNANKPQEG